MSAVANLQMTEAEWLEARGGKITATRIAGILGLHPYETPMTVYEDMKGLRVKEENEAMWFGREIESFAAAMYAKRYGTEEKLVFGKDIVKAGFYVHPENDRHAATPDYLIGDDGLLECKWAGLHAARNFGASDSDEVPTHYLLQCQWQMYVTGRKWGVLFLLSPFGMKRFKIERDPELIRRIAFRGNLFLGEYIDSEMPPPLTGHDPDSEWIKNKYPQDSGEIVQADEAMEGLIAELGHLVIEDRKRKVEIEERKNQLKQFMGEASFLKSSEGDFSWKRSRDSWETDYEAAFQALTAYACMCPDPALIKAEAERLELDLTQGEEGVRRFLMPWKSERA